LKKVFNNSQSSRFNCKLLDFTHWTNIQGRLSNLDNPLYREYMEMKFNKLLGVGLLGVMLLTGTAFAMDKININTATSSELQTLNGVGEATADAIILYREEKGLFTSVEGLVNVKGIGTKKVEKLADSLTVSDIEK